MMGAMRRWFVLLLIALLPLRGWVGEAMAGEMLGQHVAAASATQAQQAKAVLHDCTGHEAAASNGSDADKQQETQSASGDCPTCASCQVCSTVVLSMDTARVPAAAFGSTLVPRMGTRFASAEPAPAFKPPIS